jgi:hypothetical protein
MGVTTVTKHHFLSRDAEAKVAKKVIRFGS